GLRRTRPERRVQQKHRAGRTARSLQYRSPEGGAAAGRVTFAKDFLKVAVQKLNNSIFHSSIPCLLFGAARRQVAFARTRLPPPYRRMGLFPAPDECCRTGFGATRPPTRPHRLSFLGHLYSCGRAGQVCYVRFWRSAAED